MNLLSTLRSGYSLLPKHSPLFHQARVKILFNQWMIQPYGKFYNPICYDC